MGSLDAAGGGCILMDVLVELTVKFGLCRLLGKSEFVEPILIRKWSNFWFYILIT